MSMFTDLSQASSSILASYVTTGLGILHLYLAYKNYWRQTETPTDLDGSEKQSTVRFTPQENSNSNTKAQESHTVDSRSTKVNGDMSNTVGNPTSPSRPPSIPLVGPTSPAKTATRTSSLLAQPISEGTELQLTPEKISDGRFDIQAVYNKLLENQDLPMPVAAILALTELISNSKAATMYELVEALKDGASDLKKKTPNPISLTAGCDLFIRYVTTARQDFDDFFAHKTELVRQGRDYAAGHAAK
ncbi:translation initiation factor eIF-2B subunit alpha, partial [Tulasnella sp. 419]